MKEILIGSVVGMLVSILIVTKLLSLGIDIGFFGGFCLGATVNVVSIFITRSIIKD